MTNLKKELSAEKPETIESIDPKYAEIRESVLEAIEQVTKVKEEKNIKDKKEKNIKDKKNVKNKKKQFNKENLIIPNKFNKNKINFMIKENFKKENNVDSSAEKVEDKNIEIRKESTDQLPEEAKKDQSQILETNENVDKKSNKKIIKFFLLSILVTIFVLFFLLIGAIYILKWNYPTIQKIVSILPLPVGFYDYKPISLKSYWEDFDTLNYFYNNQVSQGVYKEMPSESELKNMVWDRLLNMKIIEELAKKYEVTVTTDDIKEEIDTIVNEAGSKEILENNLYQFYQWDIKTFSYKVISPYILERKVWKKISSDSTYDQAAKTEAQQVLNEVRQAPEKFAEIAARVSDDHDSASRGGDLGYFNQGVMIPEFEQVAFNLSVGEISDLVKTQFGYHIIKVDDRIVSSTDDKNVQIKASHILIAPESLVDILEKYKQDKKVIRLLDK